MKTEGFDQLKELIDSLYQLGMEDLSPELKEKVLTLAHKANILNEKMQEYQVKIIQPYEQLNIGTIGHFIARSIGYSNNMVVRVVDQDASNNEAYAVSNIDSLMIRQTNQEPETDVQPEYEMLIFKNMHVEWIPVPLVKSAVE